MAKPAVATAAAFFFLSDVLRLVKKKVVKEHWTGVQDGSKHSTDVITSPGKLVQDASGMETDPVPGEHKSHRPICPLSSLSTKIAEPDSWAQVKTRNHGHGKSSQLESQTDSRSKNNQFTGSRFAVLADDMDKSFPVFNAEQDRFWITSWQ